MYSIDYWVSGNVVEEFDSNRMDLNSRSCISHRPWMYYGLWIMIILKANHVIISRNIGREESDNTKDVFKGTAGRS